MVQISSALTSNLVSFNFQSFWDIERWTKLQRGAGQECLQKHRYEYLLVYVGALCIAISNFIGTTGVLHVTRQQI